MRDAVPTLTLTPLLEIPEVVAGSDLSELLADALHKCALEPRTDDVLVVAQKIMSKAEGRVVDLTSVVPGSQARELAALTGKDARLVELILSESSEVLRAGANVLIVRHRLGFVMANAGIDRSNVPGMRDSEVVLLLPRDPDASAAALRTALGQRFNAAPGVVVSDSFGRPWRRGVVNVALGAAGIPALLDRRGEQDRNGRRFQATEVAIADAIAAAAGLVMGEAAEGIPAVLVRGLKLSGPLNNARSLVRPLAEDLFR